MEEFKNDMFRPMYEKPANYIKVIGVGGGGGNAVNHMLEEGIQGVDFILCNTDYQALMRSTVPTKVHLGKRQLGAGNDPAVGREAALSSEEEIDKILDESTQMVFVTAGMGGGTGTGAAPVVARIAKEKGILTVGIVTIPFECEGRRRKQQAQAGIEELKQHVDTLIVISSDTLRDTYGNMKLTDAFKKADDVLATAAKGIAEIITVTGYVNVDFEDVKTVMRNSGKAIMGTGRASGENRAEEAIKLAINSPLLNDNNIEGAKNILIYITSGSDEVSLDEVVEITEYAQSICGSGADVIWGNGVDESLGEDISVTLIATGFDSKRTPHVTAEPAAKPAAQPEPVVCQPATSVDNGNRTIHRLDEEEHQPEHESVAAPTIEFNFTANDPDVVEDDTPHAVVHSLNENTETRPSEAPVFRPEQTESAPSVRVFENPFAAGNNDDEGFEISNSVETRTAQAVAVEVETLVQEEPQEKPYDPKEELKRNRLRALSLNFKTQKGLEELEREPAYMRRNRDYEELEIEEEVSEYSASSQGISTENSYLHQRVD